MATSVETESKGGGDGEPNVDGDNTRAAEMPTQRETAVYG